MASSSFVSALYQICVEEESTATVEALRNKALEKIANGGGEVKTLVSSSIQGKSFSFNISKSADVLFADCSEAVGLYRNGAQQFTVIDFSGI